MNHKQLTFAREFRGLSQTELAKSIEGLSQSNLSKFEKGLGTLSESLLLNIYNFLGFPKEFFEKEIVNTIENAHYRKKATINKSNSLKFENTCKLLGYIVDEMSDSIEWPEFILKPLNVDDGYDPEYIAKFTRKLLGLKTSEPVKNIFSSLEKCGIIIYEIDEIEKFDGVSFLTDKGFPIIVVNRNFSNDRKRFTIAHELGHILMHVAGGFPISKHRDSKTREDEANIFASEFLMPKNEIINSLRGLKLSDLSTLKNYWLTSMASIIRKARDLNCINDNKYKYFIIEMSRKGYNKNEPFPVFIDESQLLKRGINIFRNELNYDIKDFESGFGIPNDIFTNLFDFKQPGKIRVLNIN